jgi:hypothetical protein
MGFWWIRPDSKEGFLVAVPKRSRQTLLPFIKERILLGTTIISDEARVYWSLEHESYIILLSIILLESGLIMKQVLQLITLKLFCVALNMKIN